MNHITVREELLPRGGYVVWGGGRCLSFKQSSQRPQRVFLTIFLQPQWHVQQALAKLTGCVCVLPYADSSRASDAYVLLEGEHIVCCWAVVDVVYPDLSVQRC